MSLKNIEYIPYFTKPRQLTNMQGFFLLFLINILTLKNAQGNSCNTTISPLDGASDQQLFPIFRKVGWKWLTIY